jgi:DNA-binding MarR family transcriptional regulator
MKVTVVTATRAAPAPAVEEGCGLLLSRLARAANSSLAAALDDLGLRSIHFAILHQLAGAGPSSQAELASSLRMHAPNLVRVLDEMEEAGLIGRERDPADRRRQIIVLERRGATMLGRAERAAAETEAELLAALSPSERSQLRALLGRVASHACSRGIGACG